MNQAQPACKACGRTEFVKGKLNNGYARVMPINKAFSLGSGVIYTFCKRCGEIASMKIESPEKF